jgi:hypothetical protein
MRLRINSILLHSKPGVSNSNPSRGHIWMENVFLQILNKKSSAGRSVEKYATFSAKFGHI